MNARRLVALLVAALAAVGVVWSAQRLAVLGAPIVPPALARLLAPSLGRLIEDVLLALRQLGLAAGALAVGALQVGVVALAIVAVLAMVVAWRGPRQARTGAISVVRTRPAAVRTGGRPARARCPACGQRVQTDWLTCPNCAASLPVAQAS